MNTEQHQVSTKLLGHNIDLQALKAKLHKSFVIHQYRDALYIAYHGSTAFVFDYGVICAWKMKEEDKTQLLVKVLSCTQNGTDDHAWENFHFKVEQNASLMVRDDEIRLPDDDLLTLLAVSHGLAQSEKLEQFEVLAEKTIREHSHLSETLAKTGKIPLSRKALAKARGSLFQTRNDIVLRFNLLDTPEFFWEYPEQEANYLQISRYLDLQPRVELLNLKLSTINELLEMLASEQNHKHSAFLEWIIIYLIAVDIILYFGH
ncbi:RMD1 family protein [Planctobacterium marinum]|uniref:RMD1 family protein n=1 Tax=Planctobacterium marinum TaxID=1631968 RepID=UPI001E5D85DC|nr:RMD1 family protein [Planctobacterium marinum]MCC2607501.1 RMD1 family protein [Planctobacterium marinum]